MDYLFTSWSIIIFQGKLQLEDSKGIILMLFFGQWFLPLFDPFYKPISYFKFSLIFGLLYILLLL